ncbi:response regulator [Sediminibacterium roseum]|uniref:Response regulator n=1 Tax=Sediminibacterium roseum TaxID=1978412 RepID=A0ABW9ZQK1_9BACT|nr:response regulator [Sediminibacterium roseum]NCI49379.1 response regulator [Sediminibacterium roseum]
MPRSVLIIDDEVDLCTVISSYLRRKDYTVDCAHSLADGLKKLDDVHPDVVLLDNNLPDGYGWVEAEKIHQKYPSMRITLFSAADALPHSVAPVFTKLQKPISLSSIENYL